MKCMSVGLVCVMSVWSGMAVMAQDAAAFRQREQALQHEHAQLERQLQQIRADKRAALWANNRAEAEAALQAERQRRQEAKYVLEAFAGYRFGTTYRGSVDDANSRVVKLFPSIRVFDSARLFYTPTRHELWKVELVGEVDGTTSRDDCYLELSKIMEIIEDKYKLDLWQFMAVGDGDFRSKFTERLGRMTFAASVQPSGVRVNGRNRIRFVLSAANHEVWDKEPSVRLDLKDGKDASRF